MLKLDELTKDFGGLRAVDHCSFEVPEHTLFGLIGPNGSGKSTIFNLDHRFSRADVRDGLFQGPGHHEQEALRGQPPGDGPDVPIGESLSQHDGDGEPAAGAQRPGGRAASCRRCSSRRACASMERQNIAKARALLDLIGLRAAENSLAGSLSYAEQKMVEISRAMMTDPDLIMLDEPASGINPTLMNRILELHPRAAGHAGQDIPHRGARHARRDEPVRADRRPELRAEDRRRHGQRGLCTTRW